MTFFTFQLGFFKAQIFHNINKKAFIEKQSRQKKSFNMFLLL